MELTHTSVHVELKHGMLAAWKPIGMETCANRHVWVKETHVSGSKPMWKKGLLNWRISSEHGFNAEGPSTAYSTVWCKECAKTNQGCLTARSLARYRAVSGAVFRSKGYFRPWFGTSRSG